MIKEVVILKQSGLQDAVKCESGDDQSSGKAFDLLNLTISLLSLSKWKSSPLFD